MNKEPWNDYPHIWKTKAAFFTWLRGALRRAVWEKFPPKIEFKNEQCAKPPDGYTGRAKSGAYCALTGEWEGKSKLEVDHIEGNKSLRDWDDVLPFILHLCAAKEDMQLVKKEAHRVKSYCEHMGISFEEALIEKQAIAICKANEDKQWLEAKGVTPASNKTKRRQQIIDVLRGEDE